MFLWKLLIILSCTRDPSQPLVEFVNHTAHSLTLSISTIGGVEYYNLLIINKSRHDRIQYESSPQVVIIENLIENTHYNITLTAVSHGLLSSPSADLSAITAGEEFNIFVTSSTTEITLYINNTDVKTTAYSVYVENKQFSTTYREKGTNLSIVHIGNCIPGKVYNVTVHAMVADMITHARSVRVLTYPERPGNITITDNKYSAKFDIEYSKGHVDYYNVLKTSLCKTSTFLSVNYKLVKERYDWSEFLLESEPGVCCRLDIVSVSNNLSSSPLNYFVKRSEAVPGPVDKLTAKVSRMAVKLYWAAPRHPNGIIDEYTLTFGTRNKEKHVKFNCIDCPSVTNCSFIKTRMLKTDNSTTSWHIAFHDNRNFYVLHYKWKIKKFNFQIDGLSPNTEYQYSIYASTSIGNGQMFNASLTVSTEKSTAYAGPLVGGIIGSIIGSVLLTSVGFFLHKRYRQKRADGEQTCPKSPAHYETISSVREENAYDDLAV